jgi:hypothetical protein
MPLKATTLSWWKSPATRLSFGTPYHVRVVDALGNRSAK